MGISNYLRDIGRGKEGARGLDRAQATDLFGQILDGQVTDLEVGAFCLAMRIKGETPAEMAGFLDATEQRLHRIPNAGVPIVVLPSYNGARKLPVLTPLLALLLARQGLGVILHGCRTEISRVSAAEVMAALDIPTQTDIRPAASGCVQWLPTHLLSPGLQRLLDVRRVVGLRNSAHSLVKLMNPCEGPALVVGSYTHPEYAVSMRDTLVLRRGHALLLRGTEGEPVADARRMPAMDAIFQGRVNRLEEAQAGSLASVPELPTPDAVATASWIQEVLAGRIPVPAPIASQVAHIVHLLTTPNTTTRTTA